MSQEPAPTPAETSAPQKPNMPVEQPTVGRIDRLRGFLGGLTKRHPQPSEQLGEAKLPFPHGEIALKAFKKEFDKDPDKVATMGRIIDTFFDQEMDNTAIFTDPAGASLPYTKINITELARAVSDLPVPDPNVPQPPVPEHHRYFVTPSFPALQNGHQFTFVEVAFKEVMKYLPGAIEDLKAGRAPQDIEIFTIGSPTNKKWGQVTRSYVDSLHRDAYGTLGNTYALLAEQNIPQDIAGRAKTGVIFFGQSESSSLAASAAESLIARGIGTQEGRQERESGKPYIQVIMDAPVSLNPSEKREWQIKRGFGFDMVHSGVTSSHIRKSASGEAGFLDKLAPLLKVHGIETHESKEELKLKDEGKKAISGEMFNKRMPIDANRLKVNIRRGTRDRTIPQRGFAKIAKEKEADMASRFPLDYPHYPEPDLPLPKNYKAPPPPEDYVPVSKRVDQPNPLGKDLVYDPQLDVINNDRSGKVREAAIRGTHIFSVTFPKHEVQKWGVGVDRIQRALAEAA